MNTLKMATYSKHPDARHQDRRLVSDRRLSYGRRSLVRFDNIGGDRRSGYARRAMDIGFRKQAGEG